MSTFQIHLFGQFRAEYDGRALNDLSVFKVQELFCYLLLNRDHRHHREKLAGLLWGDNQTPESKKYLRQALWQLQLALNAGDQKHPPGLLAVEADWVSISSTRDYWLDIQVFDEAIACVRGVPGQALAPAQAQLLKEAVSLYTGDLLEGWYQDWCLYERERLQNLYIDMLDKLMAHCEAGQQYEIGVEYGTKILRYDRARERTHWQLMRLHYLAGDRAGALRQYGRCVAALEQELGVQPAQRTLALYEQIRTDRLVDLTLPAESHSRQESHASPLTLMLERFKSLRTTLNSLQHQVDQELQALENMLSNSP